MIRRSTWIVLALLAALIGFSFYLKGQKATQTAQATATPGPQALFAASDGAPADIKLESSLGQTTEFSRDPSGKWVVQAPIATAADQAGAEAAATQVGALQILASVQLGPDVVGLDKPAYTFTIAFANGKMHKLVVGSVTPIQNGYYTQLDGGAIQVVDKVGTDALLDLLSHPPYLATLTPVASPSPPAGPATDTPQTSSSTAVAPATPSPTAAGTAASMPSPRPPTGTSTP